MSQQLANGTCPHCGKEVTIVRSFKGRKYASIVLGIGLAIVAGLWGSRTGLASGGGAVNGATIFTAIGLLVGVGYGYIIGGKIDKTKWRKSEKVAQETTRGMWG